MKNIEKEKTCAVTDIIERYLPGHADNFELEIFKSTTDVDEYLIDYRNGKICLCGNNVNSVAAALGHYMKYTLGLHLSWCGCRIPVFGKGKLPVPKKYHHVIKEKFRVYMNYCTHSYSAAWWDFERWQFEIDMMALNGINMPLAITGTESVWYHTLIDLGFSDIEARTFLAGPAFLAWEWMTNLEGHGGPLPMSWIEEHEIMGKKIIERELSLGMIPIQQGYSGFVPNLMKEKFPDGKFLTKKPWNHIGQTTELDPLDPLFEKIGLTFLNNQRKIFGTYGFYACDPFHEGTPPVEGDEYLGQVGEHICKLYERFDENYTWVMQAWSIRKPIVMSVPKDRLLILDLDCSFPVGHEGYWGYRYICGRLHNFGARMSSLHGDLRLAAKGGYNCAKESAPSVVGSGLFMEGIGQNPVFYDLSLEMLTSDREMNIFDFIDGYIARRYGLSEDCADKAREAWKLLCDNVYAPNTDFVERGSVICTRPCLRLRGTGPCDSFNIHYDNKILLKAFDLLSAVSSDTEGYRYDMLDICRQMLSNYAQKLYGEIFDSYTAKRISEFEKKSDEFIELLDDMDKVLFIRPEWRLQSWIDSAKKHAIGKEEESLYEYNARMQVTIWGNEKDSVLFDYAWKEWSGLIGTYYKMRWQKFFARLKKYAENGNDYLKYEDTLTVFENRIVWHADKFYEEMGDMEAKWLHSNEKMPVYNVDFGFVHEIVLKYRNRIQEQ